MRIALVLAWMCACGAISITAAEAVPQAQEDGAVAQAQRHPGPDSALAAARADGDPALIVFSATWCSPCWRLHRAITHEPGGLTALGRVHLCFVDIDNNATVARAYEVQGVPHLVLVEGDGVILASRSGYAEPAALGDWIAAQVRRRDQGLWAGMTADADMPAEPAALLAMAGERDDWQAMQAMERLVAQGERAVPALIEGLDDPWLATRIAARRGLERLLPAAPVPDVWRARAQRSAAAARLRAWWGTADRDVQLDPASRPDPLLQARIADALRQVAAVQPPQRTAGMRALLRCGPAAVPSIRAAAAAARQGGDAVVARVLEDVRWAIVVPDAVQQAAPVRRQLARGAAEERRAAIQALGAVGSAALPALLEALHEDDPLLHEVALHALRQVGGAQAVAAMAGLLQATDANLRMVAAQQLGKVAARQQAGAALVASLADEDELVATTAIAALAELEDGEHIGPLRGALQDPRWRVRAAAAEALASLEADDAETIAALRRLLEDEDAFVSRAALQALDEVGDDVPIKRLRELAARHAGLLPATVARIADDDDEDSLEVVEGFFAEATPDQRAGILRALIRRYHRPRDDEAHWRDLLDAAVADPSASVRLAVIDLLHQRSSTRASAVLHRLLQDQDEDVRRAAVRLCLHVVSLHHGQAGHDRDPAHGALSDEDRQDDIRRLHQQWHELVGNATPMERMLRFFLDPRSMPPAGLVQDLRQAHLDADLRTVLVRQALTRLEWPAAADLVDRLLERPAGLADLIVAMESGAIADGLGSGTRPQRLIAGLADLDGSDYQRVSDVLLDDSGEHPLGLYRETPVVVDLRTRLATHDDPALRILAVHGHGRRADPLPADLRSFVRDPDPWVRANLAAVLVRLGDPLPVRDMQLTLLEDPEERVVRPVLVGLLATPLREAMELDRVWRQVVHASMENWIASDRSVSPVDESVRLDQAQKDALLQRVRDATDLEFRQLGILLLVENEDPRALTLVEEHLQLEQLETGLLMQLVVVAELTDLVLPELHRRIRREDQSWTLRRMLPGLRTRFDPQARALRRLINTRIREVHL
ncbi:MAG: HEAT repeat domain-containing protein [Planctomycetota bacterium]